ncbi:histidine-containing phosphotransfer protein 1 isoform X2 [Spinacia oleracea]|uniref:Histidine-containing phosphotransfer protein n=1 Tax=Spinacia oleracea TaxID=3562 RepID=A0ABM3RVL7_SPIOL|nr:histidine-containing phosphotransfer protein 1-like isoform X2 [Spinacia oleracea]
MTNPTNDTTIITTNIFKLLKENLLTKRMSNRVTELQKEFVYYTSSLFDQGILNDQFNHLQLLQDESNPEFLAEIVNLFFQDTQKLLDDLTKNLEQENVDFLMLDKTLHHIKGSSSSIGAVGVQNACVAFVTCSNEKNIEGCWRCLEEARNAYNVVRSKLDTLLKVICYVFIDRARDCSSWWVNS